MRITWSKLLPSFGLIACVTACGGDQSQQNSAKNTVTIDGDEVVVSWDRGSAEQATAVGTITSDEPVLVAARAIEAVTGCAAQASEATLGESIFIRSDGQLELTLSIDCTKVVSAAQNAQPQAAVQDASDSKRMAAAVEEAIRQVVAQPTSQQPTAQPAVLQAPGVAELYEGSPYSAFSATDIQAYCGQDWTTRVAADGRTEYNPCTQRSAFR
ncbi:MAG: hypothetical protein AAF557_00795 [Pseudomonadota bacterium]